MNAESIVVDGDRSDLLESTLGYHMSKVSWSILISLSRPSTIGQDEVECSSITIFLVVFKANELINCPRLVPLVKDIGFSLKLKQGRAS